MSHRSISIDQFRYVIEINRFHSHEIAVYGHSEAILHRFEISRTARLLLLVLRTFPAQTRNFSGKGDTNRMRLSLYSFLLFFGFAFSECTTLFLYWIRPAGDFQEETLPTAPDYSKPEYWAALPNSKDEPDEIPNLPEFQDEQSRAKADVFFVHPTTFIKAETWNADAKNSLIVYGLSPLKMQASVFNGSARVYAPRYRQAALYSFIDDSGNGDKAFEIARKDVLHAFDYYIKHYNQGRPFFVAGHSQGSMMLVSVLKEHLDKKKVPNFVAAYLPGWAIHPSDFVRLKVCKDSKDTGCYISWNSKKWGSQLTDFALPPERYAGGVCVSPVSWTPGSGETEKKSHKGGVGIGFSQIDRNYVKTKCEGEMLWVDLPSNPDYESKRGNKKNYHISDYGLFYLDIRENIKERLDSYFGGKARL
ncbi:PF11288 family protein [Leptospira wolffii serovar Khorat str. Khorat-H2]|nr:PF11288 family protein [Leptospira wolffii serovar Khorat str. Khorat-H2]